MKNHKGWEMVEWRKVLWTDETISDKSVASHFYQLVTSTPL